MPVFENLIGCPNCGNRKLTAKTESFMYVEDGKDKTENTLTFTCNDCCCGFGIAIPESITKRLLLSMSKTKRKTA